MAEFFFYKNDIIRMTSCYSFFAVQVEQLRVFKLLKSVKEVTVVVVHFIVTKLWFT